MTRESAVFLWSDRALFLGDRSETAVHRHNAIEVSLALDALGVDVCAPQGPDLRGVPGVVVRSDAWHQLAIPGPKVAVLYLDPRCAQGADLHAWLGDATLAPLPEGLAQDLQAGWRSLFQADQGLAEADALCSQLITTLVPANAQRRPVLDPRVRRVLAFLDDRLADPPSLAEAGAHVGLSPSRLGHLFPRHVGLPMRRYMLWMRLRSALTEALATGSMTDAAYAAGFSDSAHFTRTCRKMFGLPPTAFAPVDAVFVAPSVRR